MALWVKNSAYVNICEHDNHNWNKKCGGREMKFIVSKQF